MAQISNFEDIRRGNRRRKRIWQGFWLCLMIIMAFFIYTQKDVIETMGVQGWLEELFLRSSQDGFPISIPSSNDKQLAVMGSQVGIIQKGEISFYSFTGENIATNHITFQRPLCLVSDRRLITMDLGGYGLRVEEKGSVLLDVAMSDTILGGTISNSGMLAITTAHDRYTSRVEVMDKGFNNVFGYNSSEHTIIATALNDKKLAVAGITTQNGQLSCRVVLNSLNGKDQEVAVELGNELVFSLSFTNEGHLLVLSDKGIRLISSLGTVLGSYSYQEPLTAYVVDAHGEVWLVEGDYYKTHQSQIIHLAKDLSVKKNFSSDLPVTKLLPYKGGLMVLSPDGVRQYNQHYEEQEWIPVRNILDGIVLDKYLYLVTSDNLYRYIISR